MSRRHREDVCDGSAHRIRLENLESVSSKSLQLGSEVQRKSDVLLTAFHGKGRNAAEGRRDENEDQHRRGRREDEKDGKILTFVQTQQQARMVQN